MMNCQKQAPCSRRSIMQLAPESDTTSRAGSVSPLILILAIMLCALRSPAQMLSFQKFTSADGLAQDNVNKIVRDRRGFLWFCTGDGLSRFDGRRFKNYTQDEGLPHRSVSDLLETSAGEYL